MNGKKRGAYGLKSHLLVGGVGLAEMPPRRKRESVVNVFRGRILTCRE